eukprot:m.504792 g.504792  ORF g.504792 m.504792 type:complete len:52 (-) comp76275_c0_seq1:91-246(-)
MFVCLLGMSCQQSVGSACFEYVVASLGAEGCKEVLLSCTSNLMYRRLDSLT